DDILNMTHEKERLEEWTYKVLPPPPLEEGAEPPEVVEAEAGPAEAIGGTPIAAQSQAPGAKGPEVAAPTVPPAPAPQAEAPPSPAEAPDAPAAAPAEHVEPDQETFDRVLAEEIAKGTDRRVAEGRARAA